MKMAVFWVAAPCSLVEVSFMYNGSHLHETNKLKATSPEQLI
jgi:hypothetical protein